MGGGGDRSLTDAVTQGVWTVEGLSGEPYTHHSDAFTMTTSHLRRGEPHRVIALIPRQQKVPMSLELFYVSCAAAESSQKSLICSNTLCLGGITIITELSQKVK